MKHGDLVFLRSEAEKCERRLMTVTGWASNQWQDDHIIDVNWIADDGTLQELSACESCFMLETELEDQ